MEEKREFSKPLRGNLKTSLWLIPTSLPCNPPRNRNFAHFWSGIEKSFGPNDKGEAHHTEQKVNVGAKPCQFMIFSNKLSNACRLWLGDFCEVTTNQLLHGE